MSLSLRCDRCHPELAKVITLPARFLPSAADLFLRRGKAIRSGTEGPYGTSCLLAPTADGRMHRERLGGYQKPGGARKEQGF